MKGHKLLLSVLLSLALFSCSEPSPYFQDNFYNTYFEVWGSGGAVSADINWKTSEGSRSFTNANISALWKDASSHIFEGRVCLDATNKSGVGTVYVKIIKEHYVLSYGNFYYDFSLSGTLDDSDALSASICFDI